MPPKQRITREMILETSFSMFCREGMENVNARSVAKALGCSTQPIFSYYSGMEDLKNALESKAWACFAEEIEAAIEGDAPLLSCSLAYYRFAVAQPHLFRSLFMVRRSAQEREAIGMDGQLNACLEAAVAEKECLDEEKARRLCTALRIYAHGMASLQAMGLLGLSQEEAEDMIASAMKEIKTRE